LILDPFYRLYSGDISDNFQITGLLDRLDDLADKFKVALVMIGHTRKLNQLDPEQTRDWGQELIGGSYIMDCVDTALAVEALGEFLARATGMLGPDPSPKAARQRSPQWEELSRMMEPTDVPCVCEGKVLGCWQDVRVGHLIDWRSLLSSGVPVEITRDNPNL